MESLNDDCHVLLVSFPGQGNINPCIQFSKNLIKLGVKVTFSTSLTAFNRISNLPTILGLTFAPFSDGFDGNFKGSMNNFHEFNASLRTHGTEFVTNLVEDRAKQGCPFKHIIYTTLTAWIGLLAKSINVPSTFLWIQPATVLDIYYHFFNGHEDSIKNCSKDQSLELPGLPLLSSRDFPSIVFGNDWTLLAMKEHVELLNSEVNQKVLVNTFDALEFDALKVIKNVTILGIGPLIPSAFLDGNDPSDTSFGVDMRQSLDNYMDWLDSKAKESVIYIAFGSYSQIPNQLMEEIAHGLVLCKRPFLWVIREGPNGEKPFEKLSCKEELEELGKTVPWCSQVEVLQHPSLACFLTHCVGFMIVTTLQNFLNDIQKGLLKDKPTLDLLISISKGLSPNSKIIESGSRYYMLYISRAQKVWPQILEWVIKVGQLQLLRKHISYELRISCKFESKHLSSALETLNGALLNEVKAHYRDPQFNPHQHEESSLLYELSSYLDWAGIGNPYAKIYVTTKNIPYFSLLMFLFFISQVSKIAYVKNIGTLMLKKTGEPLDSVPLIVGLATIFKQFHPEVRSQFLLYCSQYVKSVLETTLVTSSKPEIPAEISNLLYSLESFVCYSGLPRSILSEHIPEIILNFYHGVQN